MPKHSIVFPLTCPHCDTQSVFALTAVGEDKVLVEAIYDDEGEDIMEIGLDEPAA